ncbi:hypothetical protein CFC21_051713 [Triticum aestivum]|uniref:Uncharacterized protein n=3 Tax=Triticum TaxID=4564 RepID=A0A9R0S7F6_TRITD|nr:hypothetical protein CFC21_051713 [Triticum aestivum]VAH89112.1 unnamed protein product [Triticum turgidum subsp. durum]
MAEREGCHSDESENDAKAHIGSGSTRWSSRDLARVHGSEAGARRSKQSNQRARSMEVREQWATAEEGGGLAADLEQGSRGRRTTGMASATNTTGGGAAILHGLDVVPHLRQQRRG